MKRRPPRKTAIALHYDGDSAPRVTAKGHDSVAEEIIATAQANGIPLENDPELTALLSQIDLGAEIPHELYVAVAEVLAYAFIVLGKFPKGWKGGEKPGG